MIGLHASLVLVLIVGVLLAGAWGGGHRGLRGPRGPRGEPTGSLRALGRDAWDLLTGPPRRLNRARRPTGRRLGATTHRHNLVPRPDRRERGARWARKRDLRPLAVQDGTGGRLVLGLACVHRRPGPLLAVERGQSLAVVGPTQSGKTTSLAIPAILSWPGPVVAASVKTDLLAGTVAWRQRIGRVWCVDPTGVTGRPVDAWSPLTAARTWAGARRVASDLTEAIQGSGTTPDGEFWYAMAAKLLAPLLHAAALSHGSVADVVRWVDTQEVGEVAEILETAGAEPALQAARAIWLHEDRQRSSVYTTAESVLEPFAAAAAETVRGATASHHPPVDPERLLDAAHTLYLCAPAHDQRRLRGLFTAAVADIVRTAFTRSACRRAPLHPPLLVVLDEAANIAPLAELDGLAATCAGHGVQLVTVWQDLAQITARYGSRAATVVNNHRAKLFLSGIADPATLDHASQLIGDEEHAAPSVTRHGDGSRSTTAAPIQRRLLPPDALRRLPQGTGVLVYGALPPAHVALRPWWQDPVLRARHVGCQQ